MQNTFGLGTDKKHVSSFIAKVLKFFQHVVCVQLEMFSVLNKLQFGNGLIYGADINEVSANKLVFLFNCLRIIG